MAKWYDKNGNLMEDDTLEIEVTKPPRNRIDVTDTRMPVVEGMTIDMTRAQRGGPGGYPMGQFNLYEQLSPRPIGSIPGGERIVVTDRGMDLITGADRRLQGDYGGIRIADGESAGTDQTGNRIKIINNHEGFAPILSQDGRIALSPKAVSELGKRQLEDEQAARAIEGRPGVGYNAAANRIDLKSVLQKQADQGFVAPGTDARNREIMRGTEARNANIVLDRSRPRGVETRINTRDQIMAQAEAAQMTPQVMTADGVMAGYDPITKRIVSDASGAQALAAAKTKDNSIAGMSDDELNNRLIALKARKIGELDSIEKFRVEDMVRKGDVAGAEALKQQLQKSKWSPEMQQFEDDYLAEYNRRKGITAKPAGGGAAGKGAQWKKK